MLPSLRRAEMEWVALEASGLLVRSTSLKVMLPLSLRVPASEISPVTSPAVMEGSSLVPSIWITMS